MPVIFHKFRNHTVSPNTEILILGTFNPGVENEVNFFYGRPRNYLWQLLPGCWNLPSLKHQPLQLKINFMDEHKIDFADLIHSVDVPVGEEDNVDDIFIDGNALEWKSITPLIDNLEKLKAVYFTRKTFGGIPNIHEKIMVIRNHCIQKRIRFCLLETPARFTNAIKQQQWIDTIVNQVTCLEQ